MEIFTVHYSEKIFDYIRSLKDPKDKPRLYHCLREATRELGCLNPWSARGVKKIDDHNYQYRIEYHEFCEFIMKFTLKLDEEALSFRKQNAAGEPITKIVLIEALQVRTR